MENKALTILDQAKKRGAMIFVNKENLKTTYNFFRPDVTEIMPRKEDFHDRPVNGKMMPRREFVDRIAIATGITWTEKCGYEKQDGSYIAHAQGKVRLPDGKFRISSIEYYEFDPELRAEEDFLNDKKGRYADETAQKKLILTYKKHALARAITGARLRVIRQLIGLPTAFAVQDIQKPMIFSRIIHNLDTKEGREYAIKDSIATSGNLSLFGNQEQIEQKEPEEPAQTPINIEFAEDDNNQEIAKTEKELLMDDLMFFKKAKWNKITHEQKTAIDSTIRDIDKYKIDDIKGFISRVRKAYENQVEVF